jgi:hypothetical protein
VAFERRNSSQLITGNNKLSRYLVRTRNLEDGFRTGLAARGSEGVVEFFLSADALSKCCAKLLAKTGTDETHI